MTFFGGSNKLLLGLMFFLVTVIPNIWSFRFMIPTYSGSRRPPSGLLYSAIDHGQFEPAGLNYEFVKTAFSTATPRRMNHTQQESLWASSLQQRYHVHAADSSPEDPPVVGELSVIESDAPPSTLTPEFQQEHDNDEEEDISSVVLASSSSPLSSSSSSLSLVIPQSIQQQQQESLQDDWEAALQELSSARTPQWVHDQLGTDRAILIQRATRVVIPPTTLHIRSHETWQTCFAKIVQIVDGDVLMVHQVGNRMMAPTATAQSSPFWIVQGAVSVIGQGHGVDVTLARTGLKIPLGASYYLVVGTCREQWYYRISTA